MRALPMFLWLALAGPAVLAQPAAGPALAPPPMLAESASAPSAEEGRRNQRIERIRIEDGGARVDELRYGGETQNITVQPRADLPAYQVLPTGTRLWNVFRF